MFRKDPETKHLFVVSKGKSIRLTDSRNPSKYLSLTSIDIEANKQGLSGTPFVRDVLGIKGYSRGAKPKIPPEQRQILNQVQDTITETQSEDIPKIDLSTAADDVHNSIENLQEQLHGQKQETGTNTDITYNSQKMRHLEMLDKTLQTISGQAKLSRAEISTLEDEIQIWEDEKKVASPEEIAQINEEELDNLKERRDLQKSILEEIQPKLRSQLNRIQDSF